MNANALKWVEALESGRFKQGRGKLHLDMGEGGDLFCCLGVACKVAVENGVILTIERRLVDGGVLYDGHGWDLPHIVREWLGLVDKIGRYGVHREHALYQLNDRSQMSFVDIAAVIRSEPPGLFASSGE